MKCKKGFNQIEEGSRFGKVTLHKLNGEEITLKRKEEQDYARLMFNKGALARNY